jgi:hypothetical protein
MPFQPYSSSFDHANNIASKVQVMKPHNLQFSPGVLVTYVLDLNILLSILFAITLNLCSTLRMGDQDSYPYRTLLHAEHVYPPTADGKGSALVADTECLVHTIVPGLTTLRFLRVPEPGCTRMRVCVLQSIYHMRTIALASYKSKRYAWWWIINLRRTSSGWSM